MTARSLFVAVMLMATAVPAAAQSNQFPGVAPPVQSPPSPTIAPGPAAPPGISPSAQFRPPQLVPRSGGLPVEVPRGGANESFGDRATRCMHYGTAAGVSPGEIGAFTRDCAN